MTPEVERFCDKYKRMSINFPSMLVRKFIYIYSEKKDFFRRAKVLSHTSSNKVPTVKSRRFLVEY